MLANKQTARKTAQGSETIDRLRVSRGWRAAAAFCCFALIAPAVAQVQLQVAGDAVPERSSMPAFEWQPGEWQPGEWQPGEWQRQVIGGQGPARYRFDGPSAPGSGSNAIADSGSFAASAPALPTDDDAFAALVKAPREPQPLIDSRALVDKFVAHDATLELMREGKVPVPRIFLARLPSDLPQVRSVQLRKTAFIKTVLPLILRANQDILAQRRRIQAIARVRGAGLDAGQTSRRFLARMAEEYGTAADDLATLLRRVDIVPPSLALAQAVEESGWGTSRFARRGNAVFGQRTYKAGHGMVPRAREAGEQHEVLAFESLQTSVQAYLWNLNTHDAYADFRDLRQRQRRAGEAFDSGALVGTMLRYSERGDAYVSTIRSIMRANRLTQFDAARLAEADRRADKRLAAGAAY